MMRTLRRKILRIAVAGLFAFEVLGGGAPALAESMTVPAMADSGYVDPATGLNKSIFLDLRDINVVDILKFLAIQGDLNIVTSKNVQGRSTLVLRNVKIRDALDIIVISNQLAYEIKNKIIYVMTEDEYLEIYGQNFNDKRRIMTVSLQYAKPEYVANALEAVQTAIGKVIIDQDTGTVIVIDIQEKLDEMAELIQDMERRLETEIVQLNYAQAVDVVAQLKLQVDAKSVGSVFADERSNQVVVSAYPGRLKEVVALVRQLDKPSVGVLLEVRILQLTLNPKFDWGIDWEKAFRKEENKTALRNLNFAGSFPIDTNISPTAFAAPGSDIGTVGKIGIGELTADDFVFEVKALKEVQSSKVLASPRLMVLNREEARINIGDRVPYVITTTTGTGNNTSVSEEIKFIDIGLSLVVTPTINAQGFITLQIRPEISSQINTLTTPTNNQIPIVNTTFVESTILVKDGISVVLGGLRRDDFTETDKGIPLLMDVPLIGNAFKGRNEETKKTEIVIFITPRIIRGDEDVTDQPLAIKKDVLPMKKGSVFNASGVAPSAQGKAAAMLGEGTMSADGGLLNVKSGMVSKTPQV